MRMELEENNWRCNGDYGSGFAPLSFAQDKRADNMEILRDKIKADKKLVVATNMELTESEAKNFWPIYDQY